MGTEEKRGGGVREKEREGRGEEGGRSEQEMLRRSSRGTGQRKGWRVPAGKGSGQGEAPFSVVPSAQVLPTTPHQLGNMLGCFIIIIGIIYFKN